MSERDTTDQTIQLGPEPTDGSEAHDAARKREEALIDAFEGDGYETGKLLSLMYSTTSSRLTVDHNREIFDPPLKVEWSVMNDDGSVDDLSSFMMTVSMPRLLRVKLYKDETNNKRYLSDDMASAIVLASNDFAPSEKIHTSANMKHRIFFAMQRLEAETGFKPHNLRDYVLAKGGSKFDTAGSWSIKVRSEGEGSISQTIRFQLEKPPGWRPDIMDDATLLSDLTIRHPETVNNSSLASSERPAT